MRWLLWLLVILAVAVGLAILAQFGDGNVAIFWPPYRVDLSANLALLLLLLVVLGSYILLRALSRTVALPAQVRRYRLQRAHDRSVRALGDALRAYFEGRFGRAERLAGQASQLEHASGVPALIAARAAHRLGETARRDEWLERAADDAESRDALLMTRAELLLDEHRPQQALALIRDLMADRGRNLAAQRIALRAHEQAGDWDQVLRLAKTLDKREAMAPAELGRYRLRAFRGILERDGADSAAVRRVIGTIPALEQKQPAVAAVLADALVDAGDIAAARSLLEQVLSSGEADAGIVRRYVRLDAVPALERIQLLEKMRTRGGDTAAMLLGLGQLCTAEALWGKAEEYLQAARALNDGPSLRLALGELYERLGRTEDARAQFRLAAEAAAAEPAAPSSMRPALPAPTAVPAQPAAEAADAPHPAEAEAAEAAGVQPAGADATNVPASPNRSPVPPA